MKSRAWPWILALAAAPAAAAGQDLAARITGGGDGVVRLAFAVREGVEICDDGVRLFGDRMHGRGGWPAPGACGPGPAVVELRVRGGRVDGAEVLRRGEPGREGVRDLGVVAPDEAARAFLRLARGSEETLFPAMLADVPGVWEDVLELGQDRTVRASVRKAALFWVGQEAAASATAELADVARTADEDQEVRDAAVFALSQRDPGESLPVLMELARTADQARTRKTAFFWLAQMDDPRVAAFFRSVLGGGGGA